MMEKWISINQGFQIVGALLAIIVLLMIIASKNEKKTNKK